MGNVGLEMRAVWQAIGWIVSPQKICLDPNTCYLWMWLYLKIVFADVMKIR